MQFTALHSEPQRTRADTNQFCCFREIHPAPSGLARLTTHCSRQLSRQQSWLIESKQAKRMKYARRSSVTFRQRATPPRGRSDSTMQPIRYVHL